MVRDALKYMYSFLFDLDPGQRSLLCLQGQQIDIGQIWKKLHTIKKLKTFNDEGTDMLS